VLAARLVADGRKRTTAPRIAAAAGAARRLHALLCEEGPALRITTSAGGVRCGEGDLVEGAIMAQAGAAPNPRDPLGAPAAAFRLEGRRKDLDGLLGKSIPTIAGKLAHATAAVPALPTPPAFAPLAFDGGGDLLVHTRDRVVRVDRASFQESPVDAAV